MGGSPQLDSNQHCIPPRVTMVGMTNEKPSQGWGCVYAVVVVLAAIIALILWGNYSGGFRLGD
jgi:hypothetical protein